MKRRIKIIIAVLVGLIFSICYSIIDKPTPIYDTECDTSEYGTVELYKGDSIIQNILCKEEHLDGLAIKLSAIGDQTNVFFSYRLIDAQTKDVLVEGEESLEDLQSGKFFNLQFEKISDSQNKQFLLSISVQRKSEDNGIQIFTTSRVDDDAFLEINDETVDGTLVLRTLTHRFDFETFFVTVCFIAYIVIFMRWMYKLFK